MFFTPPTLPPQPTTVTVWIHGTNPKHFLPRGIAQLANQTTAALFDCPPGLHKATKLDLHHYPFILTNVLSEIAPTMFPAAHFYTFGWQGKLTLEDRKNASQELLSSLMNLYTQYSERDGCPPLIVLIAHSHGGNVILHMADYIDTYTQPLMIKKAVLLACPVQKHTKHLTNHPMFERIYSLHSHTDMIQIADLQGFHLLKKPFFPLLSERHFNTHPKIAQVCICWKNGPQWHPADSIVNNVMLRKITKAISLLDSIKKKRGLFHVEFKLLPFIRHLPFIIDHLDQLIDSNQNCPTQGHKDLIIYL